MSSHNFETLRGTVLSASRSRSWATAVQEWQVIGVEDDPRSAGICVCGKVGLLYLYTIRNRQTGHDLFPIGSSCVNLFEVEDLNVSVSVLRVLFDLRAALESRKHVTLTPEYFSRAMLADLWENGAFPPNDYNHGNGENDYKFMLDMFNNHRDPSTGESRKIWVLVNKAIKPFVLTDERLGS
ncbi:hypothetical protein VH571_11965 [Frondihabitans sp. 4ASC-45]|uniref:hypothetical protein n=1 Tax=Frondihabitans sp. 4ASC-45 TaxID=3111636 RepID=UPI003C2029AF